MLIFSRIIPYFTSAVSRLSYLKNIVSFFSDGRDNTVLLVRGLTKVYLKKMSLFFAVKDINFAVKSGECFGLLGVNGAGKSTSFKMMTGAELPTKGDSSIMNIRLSQKTSQVGSIFIL